MRRPSPELHAIKENDEDQKITLKYLRHRRRLSHLSLVPHTLPLLSLRFSVPLLTMSAAEALYRLRAENARTSTRQIIPSLLHPTPKQASKVSRHEMAGLALNGLDSLSTVDPNIQSLQAPLLLQTPREDRQTLPPPREAELQSAVTTLAIRLAPAFPLRHAQKVLEWVVRGLNLPFLGTNVEVDAVLLAALPFHATPAFASLVSAILLPTAPSRPNWTWLEPAAKQRKPISLEYVVRHIPNSVVHLALQTAVSSVHKGVSVVALSNLLANVIGRHLANSSISTAKRKELLLFVLDAANTARKENNPSRRKSRSDLLCALFVCVATAVSTEIDCDVAEAAAQTISFALMKLEQKTLASDTAVTCLALLVARAGLNRLPADASMALLSSGVLAEVLPKLGETDMVRKVYLACLMGLLTETGFNLKRVHVLKEATSVSNMELLSSDTVATFISSLLELLSTTAQEGQGLKTCSMIITEEIRLEVAALIAPLVRGSHAEGVDAALRTHFGARKRKTPDQPRYALVDAVLTTALSGTSYEVIKVESGKKGVSSSNTLLGMLSHPERVVRIVALKKLGSEDENGSHLSEACKNSLSGKLLEMIRNDEDIESVTFAFGCLPQFWGHGDAWDTFTVMAERVRRENQASRKKRKKKKKQSHMMHVRTMADKLILASRSFMEDRSLDVQALLIGLFTDGCLAIHDDVTDLHKHARDVLKRKDPNVDFRWPSKSKRKTLPEDLKTSCTCKIEEEAWDCAPLVHALASWDATWAARILGLWVSHLSHKTSVTVNSAVVLRLVSCCSFLYDEYAPLQNEIVTLVVENIKTLVMLTGPGVALGSMLSAIWSLCAKKSDNIASKQLLEGLMACTEITEILDMLKRAAFVEDHDCIHIASFSLGWYLNITEYHSSLKQGRECITDLLLSLYKSKSIMRNKIEDLCDARQIVLSRKKKRSTELAQFLALYNTSSRSVQDVGSRSNANELIISMLTRSRARDLYGPPVLTLTADFHFIADIILDLNTSPEHRICLLRAVDGPMLLSPQPGKLLALFEHLLGNIYLSKTDSVISVESLGRVLLVLAQFREFPLTSADTSRMMKIVLEKVKCPQTGEHSDLVLASDMQLVVMQSASQIFSWCIQSKDSIEGHQELFAHLLMSTMKSTAAGRISRQFLDSLNVDTLIGHALPFLNCLFHNPTVRLRKKSRRAIDGSDVFQLDGVTVEAGVGAVETLRRLGVRLNNGICTCETLIPVVSLLWKFLSERLSGEEEIPGSTDEDFLYRLECVLDTLSLFHQQQSLLSEVRIDSAALVSAMFFPGLPSEATESALNVAVKKAALRLLRVLAPTYADELREVLVPQIESLITNKWMKSLQILHNLVPCLLLVGCDFQHICVWIVGAVYTEKKVSASEDERRTIASICRLESNLQSAASCYVQELSKQRVMSLGPRQIAQESSLFLLAVGQGIVADILAISCLQGESLSMCVCFHFLHPDFVTKVRDLLEASDTEALESAFSEVFLSLLRGEGLLSYESVSTVLAFLPLSSLATCVSKAITENDIDVTKKCLNALSERLGANDVPLACTWNLLKESARVPPEMQKNAEEAFIEKIGGMLCQYIENRKNGSENVDIASAAMVCLEKMCSRIGSASPASLLTFSAVVLDVLRDERCDEAIRCPLPYNPSCLHVAKSLSCLSSMMPALGKNSVTFIPTVLEKAVTILKTSFTMDSMMENDLPRPVMAGLIGMSEGAILACITVLDTSPNFFGRSTLQAIAGLILSSNVEVLNELFYQAVQKVPANVFVVSLSAIAGSLTSVQASSTGLAAFLSGFTIGIQNMRKSEIKFHMDEIVSILLNCLGVQRCMEGMELNAQSHSAMFLNKGSNVGEEQEGFNATDSFLSACREVDKGCAAAFEVLVLRLSESEFKDLFQKLMQWLEGGQMSSKETEVLDSVGVKTVTNIHRAVPFFRICFHLFGKLQSLFVPFFVQLLEQVLQSVEKKYDFQAIKNLAVAKGDEKKRKRSVLENENVHFIAKMLEGLILELRDLCLDNLTLFLQQDIEVTSSTASLMAKIQAGLLSAFDNEGGKSDRVARALDAYGARVVSIGSSEDIKEQSRNLLMSFSRELLLHTRSSDPVIREAALICSRSVATTVGEEFLVTLPETMPILAEVIDDEVFAVQKAAKSYVEVMEDLSGESIMDEIK